MMHQIMQLSNQSIDLITFSFPTKIRKKDKTLKMLGMVFMGDSGNTKILPQLLTNFKFVYFRSPPPKKKMNG